VSTFTAHYSLTKPDIGGDNDAWGGQINGDLDKIDTELYLRVRTDVAQTLSQPLTLNAQTGQAAGLAVTRPFMEASLTAYDTALKRYIDNRVSTLIDTYVLPKGTIIMWGGLVASIPWGWGMCDGTTWYGHVTPNFSARFILAADPAQGAMIPGYAGGSANGSHTHGTQEIFAGAGPASGHFYNQANGALPPYYAVCYIMRCALLAPIFPV
jgi:hypothetical protein